MTDDRQLHKIMVEQGHQPTFVPPKPRKKRDDEESRNQRELIKWWAFACRGLGVPEILLFSVPNGGWRSPITGAILKAEGARKGVPDLFLAWGRGVNSAEMDAIGGVTHLGLFIEMKAPSGHLSPEQEVYHQHLRAAGYRAEVCRSWQEAKAVIENYLT